MWVQKIIEIFASDTGARGRNNITQNMTYIEVIGRKKI